MNVLLAVLLLPLCVTILGAIAVAACSAAYIAMEDSGLLDILLGWAEKRRKRKGDGNG